MKRPIFLPVLFSALLCLLMTGCKYSGANSRDSEPELSPETLKMVKEASTAYDVASLLTNTASDMKYSECENDDSLDMYFDLLCVEYNKYYIAEQGGERYALFIYQYLGYGAVVTSITGLDKQYGSDGLSVAVSKEMKKIKQLGCEPDVSTVRCIVRLDREISSLTVDGMAYSRYDGGYICVGDLWGVVDENLDVIVPIQYDIIRELGTFNSDNPYYYMTTEAGMGLMDQEYRVLLEPAYGNIFFVNDNRFVVTTPSGAVKLTDSQIGVVDRNGDLICDYINGFIDGSAHFNNAPCQAVFSRMGNNDNYLEGVVDSELNIIIEPIYNDVVPFNIGVSGDVFYVVENSNGEFAVFDSNGELQQPFEKTSVYDSKEKYYKQHMDVKQSGK